MQIPSFWSVKIPGKIETAHCMQVRTQLVSKISRGRSLSYNVVRIHPLETSVQVLSCDNF